MAADEILRSFPALGGAKWRVTSPESPLYNCAAWAVGETDRWWDPGMEEGYYWPAGITREQSVATLVAVFRTIGYKTCLSGRLEDGLQKLAIYGDAHGRATHVARQLPSGAWTSKLGASEDIEHSTAEGLEGALYGKVVQFLSKHASVKSRAARTEDVDK